MREKDGQIQAFCRRYLQCLDPEQAAEHGSCRFSIPFPRQQLADYLGVERSALSNELSKMQREGLISYHKNQFTLADLPQEL